jgi:Cd2+/Zn2+-exporting ATPase
MKRRDKKKLYRIIAAAVISIIAVAIEHFSLLPQWLTLGSFDLQALLLFIFPYAIIGYDILWRAARNIVRGQVFDENFLMAIATVGAFVIGEYHEAVFVMLFYQVGELFQSIAVGKSRNSIKSLLSIRADNAFVEGEDGELYEKPCEDILVGDIICVKAGGKIPLDGIIIDGKTTLNTVALTGESLPREASEGDEIYSGCINESGFIKIRVTKPFEESTVSKILALVESSTANKAKSEEFITKFARVYTPIVVISAALLAVAPPIFIEVGSFAIWKEWVLRAMTFLVISCPCALVISVPLSYFGGIGSASRRGILIKGSNYLDTLSTCDTVIFDKTGTLTEGAFAVTDVICAEKTDREKLLSLAASAEKHSTHPIARSIVSTYEAEFCATASQADKVDEIAGRGISAQIGQKTLLVGNLALMQGSGIEMPAQEQKNEHCVSVYVAFDGKYVGCITVSDKEKLGAKDALKQLKRSGIKKTIMLTGDRESVAKKVAGDLLIDSYRAELLPQDKVEAVEGIMKEQNGKLIFVGDGINDAPVLARADIGIAMGALGSDAAIEAADVVLMNDDLSKISEAILLSRRTRRIVIENIIFALGIKIGVLILGALGLVGLNAAVFADVGVAVIAILNSMRNLKK